MIERKHWQPKRKPGRKPQTPARKAVGRPKTGVNEMIAIRWPRPLLDGIDKYARDQMLARPVALRQIVTRFLCSEGILDSDVMFPQAAE